MRAAIFNGPRDISVGDRPDPTIEAPTDAIVRVVLGCVCGSDLWYYRGQSPHEPGSIGHEFVGIVEEIGPEVAGLTVGDLVVAPFLYSDGTCPLCRAGWPSQCLNGGAFGRGANDGGQGEFVRVPFAGSTIVRVPGGSAHSDETMRSLLALSDVMGTGYHAAISAGVGPGMTVAVVGDGAVGLCAVIGSRRLGAARIIALSRNPARQKLAQLFGATHLVPERGDAAIEAVRDLTDGLGVDAALECVGTGQSMATAFGIARAGTTVGAVGAPHDVEIPEEAVIFRNVGVRGGVAPVRRYLPQLIDDVLADRINPGRVFDFATDLDHVADAYAVMDERRAVKSMLTLVPA
jgi:threonine dehydrogenase-like Zn-dependent dehydrogenase